MLTQFNAAPAHKSNCRTIRPRRVPAHAGQKYHTPWGRCARTRELGDRGDLAEAFWVGSLPNNFAILLMLIDNK